jgi:hypothetical protein
LAKTVTDRLVLAVISASRYELPRDISNRLGRRKINGSLGRLIRAGLLERVPGPTCFLYRSKQTKIA